MDHSDNRNDAHNAEVGQTKKKRHIWEYVFVCVLAILALTVNLVVPAQNKKQVFDAMEFHSRLVGDGEPRSVDGGETGHLTFGPDITLEPGEYEMWLYYSTDTDMNVIDSGYVEDGVFYSDTLSKDETVHEVKFLLNKEAHAFECRTWYAGQGHLSVDRLELQEVRKDLQAIQWGLNALLAIIAAAFLGYIFGRRRGKGSEISQPRVSQTAHNGVQKNKAGEKTGAPGKKDKIRDPKKQAIKKKVLTRIAVCAVVVAILALVVNLGIPSLNKKQVFDAMEFHSRLVGDGEPRSVGGGETGHLTFGPDITLAPGEYKMRLYYSTDTDLNIIDSGYVEDGVFYSDTLSKDKTVHEVIFSLDKEAHAFECRTWYAGQGHLSVDRLEIRTVRKDLKAAQLALNILLAVGLAVACALSCLSGLREYKRNEEDRAEAIDDLPWKTRFKKSLPVAILFTFTLFIAGPIGLYLSNVSEFWFSLPQMLPSLLAAFLIVSAVIAGLLSVVPGKVFPWILGVAFGIGATLYIEGNYLVQDYGILNGDVVVWDAFAKWAVIDTVIWVALILLVLFLTWISRKWADRLTQYGSMFLVAVQAVALIISLATAKDLDKSAEYLLTDKNYTVVSEKENIIVFLLDAFDSNYMDTLLAKYPEYEDTFRNFVWYRDTAATADPTHVAMPVILTGYRYTDELSYNDYIKTAFDYTPLYKELAEQNYDVGIYTSSKFVSGEENEYITNIYNERPSIASQGSFLKDIVELTAYRYMPHISKDLFSIYSGEFDELKSGSSQGYESYSTNDPETYKILQQPLTFDKEKNVFRLYHLTGAHGPWCLDENAQVVASEDTTREKQERGCFRVVDDYLNQLREHGVYDQSTIIIMADHGHDNMGVNPLLMIKTRGADCEFTISDAPISYMDLLPTFLEIIGEDGSQYGRSVFDIQEGEQRERLFYIDRGTGARKLVEYSTVGSARDKKSWIETGNIYYGDAKPGLNKYTFGTELSFLEEATANVYITSGMSRISDSYTITRGYYSEMSFPLKRSAKNDVTVKLTMVSTLSAEKNNQLIIYANGTEVFNEDNVNGTVTFTIPKDIVGDSLLLRFEYPNAERMGWFIGAFNPVDILLED